MNTENDSKTKNIFSLNLNCSDFLILECSDFYGQKTFILDTQADISVIKLQSLKANVFIDDAEGIRIHGVTDGVTESFGTINTEILINDLELTHTFHVVPDNFCIPSDGIIGKDFIRYHKCTLDYESNTISFMFKNTEIVLPIHDGCGSLSHRDQRYSVSFRYQTSPNHNSWVQGKSMGIFMLQTP